MDEKDKKIKRLRKQLGHAQSRIVNLKTALKERQDEDTGKRNNS